MSTTWSNPNKLITVQPPSLKLHTMHHAPQSARSGMGNCCIWCVDQSRSHATEAAFGSKRWISRSRRLVPSKGGPIEPPPWYDCCSWYDPVQLRSKEGDPSFVTAILISIPCGSSSGDNCTIHPRGVGKCVAIGVSDQRSARPTSGQSMNKHPYRQVQRRYMA